MHVLFAHQNFPAQFGQVARYLVRNHGWKCTFASRVGGDVAGIDRVRYEPESGARKETHFCSRTFENQVWHSIGLFNALRNRPDIQPDLIVGHTGMVSTLYLRELYDAPIINYFEYFYRTRDSDMDFRHDLLAVPTQSLLRAQMRNAMLLLDLNNCDAGYSPTEFQRSSIPSEYRGKVRKIFDGIDVDFWQRNKNPTRKVGNVEIPDNHRIVTYVSRGMESMRGFDVFLKAADRVCRQRSDVTVLVIGEDRVCYGGDGRFTDGLTFKQWVIRENDLDLSRVHFVGRVPPSELVNVFSISDVHAYLTVPFTLSWSLFNAMACEALVVGSDTAPVRELVDHGQNGLLVDFFDVAAWVDQILTILDHPEDFQHLRKGGRTTIVDSYSLPHCLAQMLELYQDAGVG